MAEGSRTNNEKSVRSGLSTGPVYEIMTEEVVKMRHIMISLMILSTVLPAAAAAQSLADTARVDTITVRPKSSCLTLPSYYYKTRIDYSLTHPAEQTMPNLSGYEVYRMTTMRCTIKGAGMGMTAGMMAGAFGQMVGGWDEKSAFAIGGAAAVLGAIYGRYRAEDRGWNLNIRLQEDKPPGSIQFDRK
jgi:hypothetical protein